MSTLNNSIVTEEYNENDKQMASWIISILLKIKQESDNKKRNQKEISAKEEYQQRMDLANNNISLEK